MLVWLSVWSKVQTCICPSGCHCHSLSLALVKSRLVSPFWYWLTRVVPEKGLLNGCVCCWPVLSFLCSSTAPLSYWTTSLHWIACIVRGITAMRRAQQTVWHQWQKWSMRNSQSSKVWWQPSMRTLQPRRLWTGRQPRTGAVAARPLPTSFHRRPALPRPSAKWSQSWTASWLAWRSVYQCQTCPLWTWLAVLRKRLACMLLNYYSADWHCYFVDSCTSYCGCQFRGSCCNLVYKRFYFPVY